MLQYSLYGKEPYSVDQSEYQKARPVHLVHVNWNSQYESLSMHAKYHFLVNNHS